MTREIKLFLKCFICFCLCFATFISGIELAEYYNSGAIVICSFFISLAILIFPFAGSHKIGD
jgi:hypothetical protein